MTASNGARRKPGTEQRVRHPRAIDRDIDGDNIDALFAMDHLPLYSQPYRKSKGFIVDEKAMEMGSEDDIGAIDDNQSSLPSKAADAATSDETEEGITVAARLTGERQEAGAAITTKARDVRDARLGRVRMKRPKGPPGLGWMPARPISRDVIASVQRRSVAFPQSAASADRSGRRWRRRAALMIAALSVSAIVWMASDLVEESRIGQGGPMIAPEQRAFTSGDSLSAPPIESRALDMTAVDLAEPPFDLDEGAAVGSTAIEIVRAPARPVGDRGAELASPSPDDAAMLKSTAVSDNTVNADDRAATEASLAAVLAEIKRVDAQALPGRADLEIALTDGRRQTLAASNAVVAGGRVPAVTAPAGFVGEASDVSRERSKIDLAEVRVFADRPAPDQPPALVVPLQPGIVPPLSPDQSGIAAPAPPADDPAIGASGERDLPTALAALRLSASAARFDTRIVVHLGAADPLGAADAIMQALVDAGFKQPELRRVDFAISATNVRYFFPDDRADAERIDRIVIEALGDQPSIGPRDFTHYRPLPIEDTVEVWLAD